MQRFALLHKANELGDELRGGRHLGHRDAATPKLGTQRFPLRLSCRLEARAQAGVRRIHQQLPAGFRILEGHDANVRNLAFPRVDDPDRNDLMANAQRAHRLLPAIGRHEVAEHDHQGGSPDQMPGFLQRLCQVGRSVAGCLRSPFNPGDELQQSVASGRWRDDVPYLLVEEQGAHAVAATDQQLSDHR